MNMGSIFRDAVARFPERTGLVDPEGNVRYSYREWDNRVRNVGAALQASDVDSGDRVAVIAENREEVVTLFWATQRIGATFVPLNFRAAADEIAFLVNNVSAELVFFSNVSSDNVLVAQEKFEDTDELVTLDNSDADEAVPFEAFLDRGDTFTAEHVDPEEESLILHTSGTTGNPKGVPISHRANYARTVGNPIHLDWRQGETTLGIMPNFHEMGRAAITSTVLLNGTYVAMREWSPARGFELIDEEDIDILYLVPTMFHDLVDADVADDFDPSHVRTVSYAGTAMSERVHQEVRELFEPDSFTNFYGSSEMNAMTTCTWLDEKPACAGRAGIHTRIRVVEPVEGETVAPDETVPRDELGEIIVDANSPEAFDGYLDRPEANETSFRDGWYFTGDLGYRDEDDDLWVVGRVDDMIISGGENIYPVEIEDLLDHHELVGDVAIGSVKDDRMGELVTAYVALSDDDTLKKVATDLRDLSADDITTDEIDYEAIANELDDFCKESDELADFKRPRKYVFIAEVPKSNVGKKLRRKLRAEDLEDIGVTINAQVDI